MCENKYFRNFILATHAHAGGHGLETIPASGQLSKRSAEHYLMSLYRFFKKQSPEVPSPNGPLSRSPHLLQLKTPTQQSSNVQIAVIKLPRSRGERTSSLPPKPKQPLLSTPSYMEIRLLSVITLTAKGSEMLPVSLWHGNSSSKTELQTFEEVLIILTFQV